MWNCLQPLRTKIRATERYCRGCFFQEILLLSSGGIAKKNKGFAENWPWSYFFSPGVQSYFLSCEITFLLRWRGVCPPSDRKGRIVYVNNRQIPRLEAYVCICLSWSLVLTLATKILTKVIFNARAPHMIPAPNLNQSWRKGLVHCILEHGCCRCQCMCRNR